MHCPRECYQLFRMSPVTMTVTVMQYANAIQSHEPRSQPQRCFTPLHCTMHGPCKWGMTIQCLHPNSNIPAVVNFLLPS